MDRSTFITLYCNKSQKILNSDVDNLILEYLVEMGKEESKSRVFIETLKMRNSLLYASIFINVLAYYKNKFNICVLKSKDGIVLQTS